MTASITLKDISSLTGFSISTVSKALNNKLDISPETRKSIKDIAKKHNYIPNNFAVGLRKKRTQTIAVIIPQVNTDFYSCFLYHIEKVAASYGYRIILFQSFEDNQKEKKYLKNSRDGSVDGVILLSKNSTINERYNHDKNLAVEYIQVLENYPQERLKKLCISSFSKLLKRIN